MTPRSRTLFALATLAVCTAPAVLLAQSAAADSTPAVTDSLARAANAAALANTTAINFVWTLVAGFLVMLMQFGFAMVETGFTRAKNAAHTATMNFMVYGIAMAAYWVCGFAIQAGGLGPIATLGQTAETATLTKALSITLGDHTWNLMGLTGFFLTGVNYTSPVFAYFLFQMVFMDTTATIPTGALAERWKWWSFVGLSLCIGGLIYPLYANWVWGGGWLSQLGSNLGLGHGHVDFAGSSVVHMTGGVIALVTAKLLGARRGKYGPDGRVNAIPGHNIPMAMFGTFVLCFGWFGFNAGSTLAGGDLRIGVIATNTMLAGAFGSLSAMAYMVLRHGKPDPSMLANGVLAGLVAITAPCAFVTAPVACLIGAIAGVLVCWSVYFVDRTLKIDDPVGAISVHGVNGAWGVLSLGLFADGTYGDGFNGVAGGVKGLFYGDAGQFAAQLIGTATNIVVVGALAYVCWQLVGLLTRGHRVSAEAEELGLDLPEMGALAYPDTQDISSAVVLAASSAHSASPSTKAAA
ncbi:MAG TPA: ammonium transporter [Gemmatimonadales bacterium]|nr:ammonium transporter [Gemmatimonadales bacterium]